MILYVIRHGQTDLNVRGVIQGTMDIALNEEGVRQAEALAPFFRDKTVNSIYTSPRKRAKQTAQILNSALELPLYEDERLVERAFGELEGQPYSVLNRDASSGMPMFFLDDYCKYGAEAMGEMQARIEQFLEDLSSRGHEAVIVVTHGGVAAYLAKRFSAAVPEHAVSLNGEITKYILEQTDL